LTAERLAKQQRSVVGLLPMPGVETMDLLSGGIARRYPDRLAGRRQNSIFLLCRICR